MSCLSLKIVRITPVSSKTASASPAPANTVRRV